MSRHPRSWSVSVTLLVLLAVSPAVLGDTAEEPSALRVAPVWSAGFETPVLWQRVTPMGHLIVNTTAGLFGIDPAQGEVAWGHSRFANLSEEGYSEIAGTPLVVLGDGQEDPRIVVLDSVRGTRVFDSREAGLVQVLDQRVLLRTGGLLVVGFEAGEPRTTVFLYDLESGERRWRSDALNRDSGKVMTLFSALVGAATDTSPLSTDPLELDDGTFLLAAGGDIYKMSAADGEVIWKATFVGSQPYRMMLAEQRPGVVFAGTQVGGAQYTSGINSVYQAFRLEDGAPQWDKPARVPGTMNPVVVFTDRGLIVSEATEAKGSIRLLDYATGKSLWGKKGKGIKVQGGIVDHAATDAGMVLTTGFDNAWTNKGTEYLLHVLDVKAGALRFEKPLKVRGRILSTEVLPKGVLYVTTSEVNILDPATGRPLSKQIVRSKESLVTATHGDRLYAFSADDGALYRVEKSAGTITRLSQGKVALQGKELPGSLEAGPDGVTLLSSQNVVAFTPDGAVRFHAYHPAPRFSALMRALLRAQAVRAAMASVASGATGVAFAQASNETESGSVNEVITTGMAEGYAQMADDYAGLAGQYARAARTRFHASAVGRDFVFMMVRGEKKGYGLAQVSKRTGEIVALIDMAKDQTPSYAVDDVDNRIYYLRDPRVIVSYKF